MRTFFIVVALAVFLIPGTPAAAQSTAATVNGTIEDATGALIPGVTVTATNTGTGVVTNVISNEAGAYNFPSLPPGVYRVSAQLPGFQTATYTGVSLGNRDQLRLNFSLKIASVTSNIEVTVAADSIRCRICRWLETMCWTFSAFCPAPG